MSYLIAISGKGGVGKTTVAALLIGRLIARKCTPVLAVDADPNMCLDTALGIKVKKTVGGVREEVKQIAGKGINTGLSKQALLEAKIEESMVETDNFDLIAMGRPEGPGCYCYANNVLKAVLTKLSSRYPYVVLDNEAGLENLSRRIVQKVDLLVMVSDSSSTGLKTVNRLYELALEMKIEYYKLALVINRVKQAPLPEQARLLSKAIKADLLLGLADDVQLTEFAESGKSYFLLPEDNFTIRKIDSFLDDAGIKKADTQ
jgi:CO dehydrogenase maturation factor